MTVVSKNVLKYYGGELFGITMTKRQQTAWTDLIDTMYSSLDSAVWTLEETETFVIDADTIDHTSEYVMNIDVGVNAADVDALRINLDIGTALVGETAKGVFVDANGLTGSDTSSAIIAFDSLVTMPTGDISDGYGYRAIFDGMRNQIVNDYGLYVENTETLNNSAAIFHGVNITGTYTHTDGIWYGVNLINANEIVSGTATGINILIDSVSFDNPKLGIVISKDLTNATAAGTLSRSNGALEIYSTNASSASASDVMTISGYLATIQEVNSNAVATADVYSGTTLGISYSATTTGAGTATSTATVFEADYNLNAPFAGLSATSFNVAIIDFDTSGAMDYASGAYNILAITGDDAGTPTYAATGIWSGLNVDVSGMDATDAQLILYAINATVPAGGAGAAVAAGRFTDSEATVLIADGTNGINITVDADTVGIAIDAGATDHTGTDIITIDLDVNSTSVNGMNIDLDIGTALTGAAEDVVGYIITCDGHASDGDDSTISGFMATMTEPAGGRADMSAFTADIASDRSSTADTDAGLTVGFTGALSQSGHVWYGFRISSSTATYTDGQFYGGWISHTADSGADVTGLGMEVDTTSSNNNKYGISISKDLVNIDAGAGIAMTNAALDIRSINTNVEAFAMTIGNTLTSIVVSNTASAAGADVYAGTVFSLEYTATTISAGTATTSATGLFIDYNLDATFAGLTANAFDIASIDFDTTGVVDYIAGSYNLLAITGNDAGTPTYAANAIINGVNIDLSGIDVTDGDLALYGVHFNMPTSPTSTVAHIRAEENLIIDMPIPTSGAGIDGDAVAAYWAVHGKKGVTGLTLTEFYIDISGLDSVATDGDAIGKTADGDEYAYLGQFTTAVFDTSVLIEMICLEVPAVGDDDIDLYSNASGTLESGDAVGGGTQLITAGAAWTLNERKIATANPTNNHYFYLTSGNGDTAGTYNAGKFLIRIYGS